MHGTTLDQRFSALLAGDPGALGDPHACYREIRSRARAWEHDDIVVLTHHDDVRTALTDTETYSSRGLVEGSRIERARGSMSGDALAAFDEVIGFQANFVSRTDDDHHQRLRRVAHRAFTPRRVATLGEQARAHTRSLLAEEARTDLPDLMRLASRLPLRMVMSLLGIPDAHQDQLLDWSAALSASNGATTPGPFVAARDALREFRAYVEERLEAARCDEGSTDLVVLLTDAGSEDRLTTDELAAMFVQLLFAGFETTAGLIGIGVRTLLQHRAEWDRLRRGDTSVADAVEELMRHVSPSQFATRVTRHDTSIHGTPVPAGQTVMAVIAAANRDPSVFDDAEGLHLDRGDVRHHLGFGFGPHFCLGASLARLEAQVVLEELLTSHPDVWLVDEPPTYSGGAMLRHLDHVHVRFEP